MIRVERDPSVLTEWALQGRAVKRSFGLDTRTYDWVKHFVRDQKIRGEIKSLQDKIIETRALPIHRDELRKMFEARVEGINAFRITQFSDHLAEVQERQRQLFNQAMLGNLLFSEARMVQNAISFSPADLDEIFSPLPQGVRQADIEATVADLQKKIQKLEKVLTDELSPQSRWYYRDNGVPEPYPNGCRWSLFVKVWKDVVRRINGAANIEGHKPETPEEFEAYGLLELERVRRVEPLRKPKE